MKSFPVPTNIKELRRWLGVVGYLRKFLKGFSKITFPLRQLLIQGTPWNWGAEQQEAFDKLKEMVLSETTLAYPNPDVPYIITLDESAFGLGYSCSQVDSTGTERFLAFMGRATSKREQSLPATMLELLAMISALKAFHPYIGSGKLFKIRTDHLPLQFIQDLKLGTSID